MSSMSREVKVLFMNIFNPAISGDKPQHLRLHLSKKSYRLSLSEAFSLTLPSYLINLKKQLQLVFSPLCISYFTQSFLSTRMLFFHFTFIAIFFTFLFLCLLYPQLNAVLNVYWSCENCWRYYNLLEGGFMPQTILFIMKTEIKLIWLSSPQLSFLSTTGNLLCHFLNLVDQF